MTEASKTHLPHSEAWERLAWYTNGSLPEGERHQVEAHLERCRECRRELEFLERLSASVREEEPLLLSARQTLSRVGSRIDAVEAGSRGWLGWGDLGRILRAKLAATELGVGFWRPALASVVMLAAVVTGVVLMYPGEREFRTLSSTEAPAAATAPVVRVVFDGAATADDIQRLLNEAGADIVGGPSAYGVYTVRLGSAADGDRLVALVDGLRASPLVRFAEPTSPPATRESRP